MENDLKINSKKFLEDENSSLNKESGNWEHIKSIHSLEIFNDAYAIIILTEWEEFKKLNWTVIAEKMVPPAWVFDSRSIVDTDKIRDAGLNLWRLGDGLRDY